MQNKKVLSELYKKYKTSSEGLKRSEVKKRTEIYGLNKLPEEKVPSIILTFFKQFADPLIYVLLFAGIVSFFLKEYVDSYFIFGVLTFNALIGTIQEYSANKSALSLKKMVEIKAFVVRDGYEKEVSAENLVPGDIVLLKTGNKVPADLRLIGTDNLQINESMLTGESLPVGKNCDAKIKEDATIQDKENECFAGTIVTRGIGRGIVKAIGLKTEIGKIADKIVKKSEAKPPLMLRMEKFSLTLTVIMMLAITIIAGVAFYRGTSVHETFVMAAGLAVAAIPEGLPIAITITLSIGMSRMAKRNVIVRNLVAVESLGSCTAIASDKTGTLTINELTATEVLTPKNAIISTVEKMKNFLPIRKEKSFKKLSREKKVAIASVLPNEASEHKNEFIGDPVDIAFLKFAVNKGYSIEQIHKKYDRVKLLPYSSEARYSASFNIVDKNIYAFAKGAPEAILSMCKKTTNKKFILKQMDEMAKCGLKVLSLACGQVDDGGSVEDYSDKDLKNLDFLGLIGMIDPLRPEAKDAVQKCQESGIKVLMVTGDNPKTAYAISGELGFVKSPDEVITGYQIRSASEKGAKDLDKITKHSSVYARVEPTQKLDIIKSLSRNGHFVAVTGDGVNDAPALKNANVGVAMGKNGTDIARESSDIIITDDNFASIVNGIEEGRIAYSNIRKLIFLLVSTGIAEILVFIANMIFGLPIPFFAAQLLWLNLVTEGIQDVALALEKGEGDEMKKKPRHPEEPIFDKLMIRRMALSAMTMTVGITGIFYYFLSKGWSVADTRNIAMMLFVLFENMQVLNSRSENKSIFRQSFTKNPYLILGIMLATLTHVIATYVPGLNTALKIHPITWEQWSFVLPIALVLILVMEVEKMFRRKR